MPRYRITIEYDGTDFLGWQMQPGSATIQGRLIESLRRFSGESVSVRGAGRTDSGVHALGQVAHFDLSRTWMPGTLMNALNYHLKPDPIAIVECSETHSTFDARFSATSRQYIYRILNRRSPPALMRNRVWWIARKLNGEAMRAAASTLVGHHDFTTFRAAACQAKSPEKTLDRLDIRLDGDEIIFDVQARSFLHNQVRSMVGSLKLVGDGRWTAGDLAKALNARDRAACGPVAPPNGLYLAAVTYPATLQAAGERESNVVDDEG